MKFIKIQCLLISMLLCISYSYGRNNPAQSLGPDGLYKFTGKLNTKIPVFFWFVVKDSVLKGEVTYLKTAKRQPITVAGTIAKDNTITLYEFTKNGTITGTYEGKMKSHTFAGIWTAPGSGRELPYTLATKDTSFTPGSTALTPTTLSGKYAYRFGKNGASGEVHIRQIKLGTFSIDINCVTASPQNNIAEVETFKARMVNDAIIFKVPDTECKFRIRHYQNFIVIDRLSGPLNCGFGLNATIAGLFIKTVQ